MKNDIFKKIFLNPYGLASAPTVSMLPAILNTVSLSSVEDTYTGIRRHARAASGRRGWNSILLEDP